MNVLLIILGLLVGAIALLLVIAGFAEKDYAISREILIRKDRDNVFEYIRYLKNQDHYSKWVMVDPDMAKDYRGTDGLPGFVYAWDGNKQAGKGEQEIKAVQENERIDIELRFERPFKGIAHANMVTIPLPGDNTQVKWTMNGRNPYPMNLMHRLIKGVLIRDMDTSLANLKNLLENNK